MTEEVFEAAHHGLPASKGVSGGEAGELGRPRAAPNARGRRPHGKETARERGGLLDRAELLRLEDQPFEAVVVGSGNGLRLLGHESDNPLLASPVDAAPAGRPASRRDDASVY